MIDEDKCPCIHVLRPLLIYMKITGLSYIFSRPALRPFFKIYSYTILILLLSVVVRYIFHFKPSEEGLNVKTTLKIICIIYVSIGALSTFVLMRLQHHILPIRDAIIRELPAGSELPDHESLLRLSKILAAVTLIVSATNAASMILSRLELVAMPPLPPFTSTAFPFYIFDALIVFVTQSAAMLCASVFAIFCLAIRKLAIKIAHDMRHNTNNSDVFKYQKQYQALTDATALLEQRFSYYVLAIYALQVPMVCFTLYIILRGSNLDFGAISILVVWGLIMIGMLFFISIPPILLNEQVDELIRNCYHMYNVIGTKTNPMAFQQSIQFLAFQVSSTPLSMTAGNMFKLTREMMLTMFSQILTYFIILLQSG
uniref:Odorant receptor n=1 Tax=Plectus sambesii TaxID=2011161 RepID=A0A914V8E8_9BILA